MQVTIVLKTNLGTILEKSFENKTSPKVTKSNHLFLTYTNNYQGIMYLKKPRSLGHAATVQYTTTRVFKFKANKLV